MLGAEPLCDEIPWDRVDWFVGDERFVPDNDPLSNIGMAGLAARMQGVGLQTGLQQNMAGTLAGFHYPQAGPLVGGYSHSDTGGYGGGDRAW